MILKYNLNFDDLYQGAKIHSKNSARRKFMLVIGIVSSILGSILLLLYLLSPETASPIDFALAIALLIIGIEYTFPQLLIKFHIWRFYKKYKNVYSSLNSKIDINNKGIISQSEIGENKINWNGVEKTTFDKNYILIYLLTNRNYILIPKHAVKNISDWKSLTDLIKRNTKVKK
ncbi:YcxB family protein [Candidatus Microgenomates bacterium]|nr:YcxB family protein [Candidatus Microgenomates bacterium]